MKILGQLPVVKEVSASKPFGAIINETDTNDGTPVVREIYNDPLINIYKILELAGITPDGLEDGETNGSGGSPKYQLVEAIRKLPNLLNDIEQVLTLTGSVWSVPLDIETLPNKYVLFARATDNYVSGTFTGSNPSISYPFSSSGFTASDLVIVVIDQSGVRAYPLGSQSGGGGSVNEVVYTMLGNPISFNDTDTMYYQEEGYLLSDLPSSVYIENVIQSDLSNTEASLVEMFVYSGFLLCVVFDSLNTTYLFRQFNLNDFSESDAVNVSGASIPVGVDNEPYFYSDGENVYITNQYGSTNQDRDISSFLYDPNSSTLTFITTNTLNVSFVKTTNTAAKQGVIYVLYDGKFISHTVSTGLTSSIGEFKGVVGNLFGFRNDVYFTSGEVAKKWA